MRRRFSSIINSQLYTADDVGLNPIGKVTDLLIEDDFWNVRYLVVNTDAPISRKVLISPAAILGTDFEKKSIATMLTSQQVVESPSADCDQPISRRFEQALVDYYGWPIYWLGRVLMEPQTLNAITSDESVDSVCDLANSTLRSSKEICGYQIESRSGPAGVMKDLLIQTQTWIVDFATAESGSWLPEEKSIFSTKRIDQLDWQNRKVKVDLTKAILDPVPTDQDVPAITGEPLSSQPFRIS
jgi:hypothetical protein